MKCIVKGCENHSNQGSFAGELCSPCYDMLITGEVCPSGAWFAQIEKEALQGAGRRAAMYWNDAGLQQRFLISEYVRGLK